VNVKLISATVGLGSADIRNSEELIAYTARVSNPANQMNDETAPKLLKYLITNKHWSPFEMVSMCVEIKTSRAIAAQRYAEAQENCVYPARRQDQKNRQNSVDDMSEEDKRWFFIAQEAQWANSMLMYKDALRRGIAKEQARFLLPLSTQTTIYMSGTARSWIHYIELRTKNGTQLEHKEIAEGCKNIFADVFPETAKALEWLQN
jgi:thymidylate synthase (FAD)